MVQKLSLPTLGRVNSFPVPQNNRVVRMAVSPTNSDMVVIRGAPDARTTLHLNGVQNPGELTDQDLFAFSQTTGALFGCDGFHSNVRLYRLDTGSNGLKLLESQPGKQDLTSDLKSSDELLFFDRGMVFESRPDECSCGDARAIQFPGRARYKIGARLLSYPIRQCMDTEGLRYSASN